MRIDAHVSSRFDLLADIFLRNRFDGCIAVLDHPVDHPLIVGVAAHFHSLDHFEGNPKLAAIAADRADTQLLEEARRRGLALDIASVPAPDLIAGFPDVRIVVQLSANLPKLAAHSNIYAKLVVTMETRALASETLDQFGLERCMFASGWPECGASWKPSLAAFTQACGPLPQPARERLLGGTAAEVYRIPAVIGLDSGKA